LQFRHEVKHEISHHDMLVLRQRLKAVMMPDSHSVNGQYEIRSLYFDSPDDKALREKLDGVNIREKYRLRSMVHNYYLYEKDGQMAMIPWDYNLGFGTFQGSNAQSTVNTPIDSPVSGGSGDDRPMWNWIVSDDNYKELYHQYFAEFISTVDIASIIDNAYSLIKPYVSKDPTAFYTYDEFEKGLETLRRFCTLRTESISMQLESGETESVMDYADASALNLSDMGSMGGNGGFDGAFPGEEQKMPGRENAPGAEQPQRGNGPMPADSFMPLTDNMDSTQISAAVWIWLAVSVLALAVGLLIAKRHK